MKKKSECRLTIASLQRNPSSDSINDTNAHNMAAIVFHKAFKLLDLLLDTTSDVALSMRFDIHLRVGETRSGKKRATSTLLGDYKLLLQVTPHATIEVFRPYTPGLKDDIIHSEILQTSCHCMTSS